MQTIQTDIRDIKNGQNRVAARQIKADITAAPGEKTVSFKYNGIDIELPSSNFEQFIKEVVAQSSSNTTSSTETSMGYQQNRHPSIPIPDNDYGRGSSNPRLSNNNSLEQPRTPDLGTANNNQEDFLPSYTLDTELVTRSETSASSTPSMFLNSSMFVPKQSSLSKLSTTLATPRSSHLGTKEARPQNIPCTLGGSTIQVSGTVSKATKPVFEVTSRTSAMTQTMAASTLAINDDSDCEIVSAEDVNLRPVLNRTKKPRALVIGDTDVAEALEDLLLVKNKATKKVRRKLGDSAMWVVANLFDIPENTVVTDTTWTLSDLEKEESTLGRMCRRKLGTDTMAAFLQLNDHWTVTIFLLSELSCVKITSAQGYTYPGEEAKIICEKLAPLTEWREYEFSCQAQTDDESCGLYALRNWECFLSSKGTGRGIPPFGHNPSYLRARYAEMILNRWPAFRAVFGEALRQFFINHIHEIPSAEKEILERESRYTKCHDLFSVDGRESVLVEEKSYRDWKRSQLRPMNIGPTVRAAPRETLSASEHASTLDDHEEFTLLDGDAIDYGMSSFDDCGSPPAQFSPSLSMAPMVMPPPPLQPIAKTSKKPAKATQPLPLQPLSKPSKNSKNSKKPDFEDVPFSQYTVIDGNDKIEAAKANTWSDENIAWLARRKPDSIFVTFRSSNGTSGYSVTNRLREYTQQTVDNVMPLLPYDDIPVEPIYFPVTKSTADIPSIGNMTRNKEEDDRSDKRKFARLMFQAKVGSTFILTLKGYEAASIRAAAWVNFDEANPDLRIFVLTEVPASYELHDASVWQFSNNSFYSGCPLVEIVAELNGQPSSPEAAEFVWQLDSSRKARKALHESGTKGRNGDRNAQLKLYNLGTLVCKIPNCGFERYNHARGQAEFLEHCIKDHRSGRPIDFGLRYCKVPGCNTVLGTADSSRRRHLCSHSSTIGISLDTIETGLKKHSPNSVFNFVCDEFGCNKGVKYHSTAQSLSDHKRIFHPESLQKLIDADAVIAEDKASFQEYVSRHDFDSYTEEVNSGWLDRELQDEADAWVTKATQEALAIVGEKAKKAKSTLSAKKRVTTAKGKLSKKMQASSSSSSEFSDAEVEMITSRKRSLRSSEKAEKSKDRHGQLRETKDVVDLITESSEDDYEKTRKKSKRRKVSRAKGL